MALTATIVPNADDAITGSSYVTTGAASPYLALLNNNDDTSYVGFGAAGTVSCALGDIPSATGIISVTVKCRYKFLGADSDQQTRMWVDIAGSKNYSTYVNSQAGTYTDLSYTWTTNPVTSTAWTPAVVNALKAGIQYSTATSESIRYTYLAVEVSYTPTPATVDVARHIASVELRLRQRPESMLKFDGNLDLLGLTWPLGAVDVEHTAAPHATDLGWEDEAWQLRPFALHGLDIDLNNLTVSSTLKDQEPLLCLVRDLAWSDKASGTLLDGIARFATPGATFNFSRASDHTYTNAVGESETATTDQPAYSSWGLYMLSSSGGRAAPRYYVTNNSTARTLNAAQGSFQAEVKLAAVSASDEQTVAACVHDASNWWWLYWDGINGRWVFEIRQAGSTYRAVKSASPSSGVAYQIGARWTGSNGELGLSPYTLDIFVDRVQGTSAVAGGAMTQAASANFDFGTSLGAGFDQLNGEIRKIHSYQRVLTDVQMQRAI